MDSKSTLEEYGKRLKKLIADPQNGLLLSAGPSSQLGKTAAFELTSGKFQAQYITLWGLFDKLDEFQECIEMLAQMAKKIRYEHGHWYDAIVTCTATAKHLIDYLQTRFDSEEDEIEVHYLSPFPYHTVNKNRLLDFSNLRILIFTDVVATGTLVKNLAATIERLGGEIAAVQSVVSVRDEENPQGAPDEITFGVNKKIVNHYPLTHFKLETLRLDEIETDQVKKINPATILPEESYLLPSTPFAPVFNLEEAFAQFESAECLVFGFHEMDERQFTTAFHLKQLFKVHGSIIWERVEPLLPPDLDNAVLATTYGREDMVFHQFVNQSCQKSKVSPKTIFIPKSDSIDSDFSYYFVHPQNVDLANKTIVLLLTTILRAENLRKLVSLFTLRGVQRITVICLFNRMGSRTFNFISRIKKLLRGIQSPLSEEGTIFDFISVYNISDLKGIEILKMQQILDALVSDYAANTSEASFRLLAQQELMEFRSKSIITRRFETTKPIPLSPEQQQTITLGNKDFAVRSKDGRLFCFCTFAAQTRNYVPLIKSLITETNKEKIYQTFGVLLCDVSYLRISGQFDELRRTIIEIIRKHRDSRIKIEQSSRKGFGKKGFIKETIFEIEKHIETESYFLFGLSLFSYLDQNHDYKDFIFETLNSGFDRPEKWKEVPLNYVRYYNNERIMWAISLLLHFTRVSNARSENVNAPDQATREELKTSIINYLKSNGRFQFRKNVEKEKHRVIRTRIKSNFDNLLKEMGGHEQGQKHQTIRFLYNRLVDPKEHHNPIFKDLRQVSNDLHVFLQRVKTNQDFTRENVYNNSIYQKYVFNSERLNIALDDAIHAAGALEEIAKSVSRFFVFHPVKSNKSIERFIVGTKPAAFQNEIAQIQDLLGDIRSRKAVSRDQVESLKLFLRDLKSTMLDPKSYLVEALNRYSVPLLQRLNEQMQKADVFLTGKKHYPVWAKEIDKLSGLEEKYVLIEPTLLKEVFFNLCTNVRHSMDEGFKQKVSIEIKSEKGAIVFPENNPLNYVIVKFRNLGNHQPNIENSTLGQQKLEVEQYGGSLTGEKIKNEPVIEFTLKLIERKNINNFRTETKKRSNE